MTTVAIADDHKIFCDSLESLINAFDACKVIWTVQNGDQAIKMLQENDLPDILLLDINMPGKNGIEVAEWIFQQNLPVHVLALTMENDDNSVIKMLQYGVKGYLLKNVSAEELQNALQSIVKYGYYYTPHVTKQIGNFIAHKNSEPVPVLKDREKELLQYMCTDLSYMEIAEKMFLSESTVDSYRARLFEKFNVKNRIGLLLKANSMGLIKL
ncbi:DNA-binding response regulator [Terrimonas sp.]|uniref:response regulator transcription factor n=1 Tax=Terrimonas sp. TaxID=1914338 RepID=UPI000D52271A|nr:response regulator transcription factor [Terrimonas sp.]PVD53857.1 DNA-binding response regulator [Terrimonas sp.]